MSHEYATTLLGNGPIATLLTHTCCFEAGEMSSKLCVGLERFYQIFGREKCKIIGMIHVEALPGKLGYI